MARYSSFLGRRVEVQYRASDILLPASGTFVADSGRSIFLEQSFEQRGQHKHFRWEIPYQYLVRIEEKPDSGASVNAAPASAPPATAPEATVASEAHNEPLRVSFLSLSAPRRPDPPTDVAFAASAPQFGYNRFLFLRKIPTRFAPAAFEEASLGSCRWS